MQERFICTWILSVVLTGCAAAGGRGAVAPGESPPHPSFSRSSAIEEGTDLALVAGWRPMRARYDAAFVPLEIAIINKGLPALTITRESLVIEDESGRRYPVATPEEVRRAGLVPGLDRRLGEILDVVAGRFPTYERVPSNFTPGFDDPVARDPLVLPRFAWAYDIVYFPRPQEGVRSCMFTLLMTAKELPEPIVCRFRVDGRKPT